jgi:hypothetical protein
LRKIPFALRLGGRVAVFPAKDPALIGRCYRQLVAPLSGPIKDQDLRVVAPVLRLSVVRAVIEVAVTVSHVLLRFGIFPQTASDVAAREILPGVTEIFPRSAEVLGGFAEVAVTMVVAAVVMMTMVAVVTMMAVMTMVVVVVVLTEQIVQQTADERRSKKWQHAILHCR